MFERGWSDDGILLFKYWLAVDQAEQEQRFAERASDPLKRWKISPIDLAARDKYRDYSKARARHAEAHAHRYAPWHVVDFNDQQRGRLNLIRHLLDQLPDRAPTDQPLEAASPCREAGRGAPAEQAVLDSVALLSSRRCGIANFT